MTQDADAIVRMVLGLVMWIGVYVFMAHIRPEIVKTPLAVLTILTLVIFIGACLVISGAHWLLYGATR